MKNANRYWSPRFRVLLRAASVSSLVLCGSAHAQRGELGSLLVMPEFDNQPGEGTVLTVTNTNLDLPSGESDVEIHFCYVQEGTCEVLDLTEYLTAGDTLTLLTSAHCPTMDHGYVYVYAQDPSSHQPVSFDWLTGACMMIDGLDTFGYALEPFAFKAVPPQGIPTDLDGDGVRDLDGIEYQKAPDQLLVPRFLGQNLASPSSKLIFINLTGAHDFDCAVCLSIYNDNSEEFSAEFIFHCWDKVSLLGISGAFDNFWLANSTNDDPNEIVGATSWESGWVRMEGCVAYSIWETVEDPAILAALVEPNWTQESAVLPFSTGTRENGGLLHSGPYLETPPGTSYCFGHAGSGTPCPCNNDNDGTLAGAGCANGAFASGARLLGSGVASVSADTLVLHGQATEPWQYGLYFQANNDLSPGVAWGDGLRCAGGNLRRLGTRLADASGSSDTSGYANPIAVIAGNVSAGDTKYYQLWYRTPLTTVCGYFFNQTNGYRVTWQP